MADVKVKLLRRLQGREKGETATYNETDAKRLAGYGAVRIIAEPKTAGEKPKVKAKSE